MTAIPRKRSKWRARRGPQITPGARVYALSKREAKLREYPGRALRARRHGHGRQTPRRETFRW